MEVREMSAVQAPLPEFDQEMATTRRLLERVPTDKGAWKPHVKSFSLGHLAQLVARMPGWVTNTLRRSKLDLSEFPEYSLESTKTLLAEFDRNVAEARATLAAATRIPAAGGRTASVDLRANSRRADVVYAPAALA
jgi:hypothetical protein